MGEGDLDLSYTEPNSLEEDDTVYPISIEKTLFRKRPDLGGVKKILLESEGIKAEEPETRYSALEDLITDIHNNPPDSIKYLEQYEQVGLMPLMVKGENSNRKVIFGLRYTQSQTSHVREVMGLKDLIEAKVTKLENIPANFKREYLLIDNEEFRKLKKLTYGENAESTRKKILNIKVPEILTKDSSAIKFYKTIIKDAIKMRASDIHIEPYEQRKTRIRFRVDGVLRTQSYEHITIEKRKRLVQIIKGQAELDVAESRRPQDGSIDLKTRENERENQDEIIVELDRQKKYNLRVSVLNTNHDQKIVMRILDAGTKLHDLEKLGYPAKIYKDITDLIQNPDGIILLAGPTGSGKTTTLYSILQQRNDETVNIMTVEDPIELDLYGINQTEVRPKINYDFANALRSFLRQDPDIILVGEIRDSETAEIAMQAARTGHLVFSTVHADDSIAVLSRLKTMGADVKQISSCIKGIISQKLVRKLCPECREAYDGKVKLETLCREKIIKDKIAFWRPSEKTKDCDKCSGIGYKGRTVVPELWIPSEKEREMIESGTTNHDELFKIAIKNGMWDLMYTSLRLVLSGRTSIEEILRRSVPRISFIERKDYLKEMMLKLILDLKRNQGPGDTALPKTPSKVYKKP